MLLRVVSSDNLNIIRGLNRKVEINIEYKEKEGVVVEIKEEDIGTKQFLSDNIAVGDKITLDNILFKTGYSSLEVESINVLEDIAAALLKRKDIYFTIQGHVCCTE